MIITTSPNKLNLGGHVKVCNERLCVDLLCNTEQALLESMVHTTLNNLNEDAWARRLKREIAD